MYSFLGAAVTKYHKRGGFIYCLTVVEARCLKSRSPVPVEESFLASSYLWVACGQSLVFLGLQLRHPRLCPRCHMALSLCVPVLTWPSFKDTSHIGLGPTLLQYDITLTNYTCNDAMSK